MRARPTGRTAEYRWASVWTVHDGRVAKYHVYEDTERLAAAFVPAAG